MGFGGPSQTPYVATEIGAAAFRMLHFQIWGTAKIRGIDEQLVTEFANADYAIGAGQRLHQEKHSHAIEIHSSTPSRTAAASRRFHACSRRLVSEHCLRR